MYAAVMVLPGRFGSGMTILPVMHSCQVFLSSLNRSCRLGMQRLIVFMKLDH